MTPTPRDPVLFNGGELSQFLQRRLQAAKTAIGEWDADALLATSDDDVMADIVGEFDVECPVLRRDGIEQHPAEDGYYEHRDAFGDLVTRHESIRRFAVPFAGDVEVFGLRATTFLGGGGSMPAGVISQTRDRSFLSIAVIGPAGANVAARDIDKVLHEQLDRIDRCLAWAAADIEGFRTTLQAIARQAGERKAALLKDRQLDSELGYPVVRRHDADAYLVPVRRRRLPVRSRSLSPGTAFQPEPAIAEADYEEVLRTLTSSRNALERAPSVTTRLTEEQIRDLLLVNLNAVFEGRAGGETFNGAGKTDILVRVDDRNVFIGECKIYRGPASVSGAITQLLTYLVWRDTKAALLLFIRRVNVGDVLSRAHQAVEQHPNFKRTVTHGSDHDRYDYVLRANDDSDRQIRLALLPLVLPPDGGEAQETA